MKKELTYEDILLLKENRNVYFIDVREPNEIESTGLIPGSKNIPKGDVQKALVDMPESDLSKKYGIKKPQLTSEIVFTCRSGRRAKDIMETMEGLGFTDVKYYPGSWLEWESRNSGNN